MTSGSRVKLGDRSHYSMPKTSNNALILFARTPLKGQVKTRLYPSLDHETIFQLYSCFLQDSIQKICMVENTDLLIGISSSQGSSYFENLAPRQKLRIVLQEGVDLGERMRKTFADRFAEGYQKTVIIGSDSPSLPSSYLEAALGSDKDITLGPCIDGGYYLIGLRNKLGDIFDEVDWGTSKVLEQTFRKIRCRK